MEKEMHRRNFLLHTGGVASAAALITTAGCKKDEDNGINTSRRFNRD